MTDLVAYRSLALAIANDFFLPGADRDDVEQEALIALWIASRDYRAEAGVPFGAFAAIVIRRRLGSAVKMATAGKHRPLNERAFEEIPTDEGVLSILDTLPAPASDPARIVEDREEALELLRRIAEDLTPLERRALIAFANGQSFLEIAAEVGGTTAWPDGRPRPKRVENAVERARRKLAFEVAA